MTRLLIVEDNPEDRYVYRRLLSGQGEGFEFLESETGEEGLRLYFNESPDCVLLDFELPDLNGIEFLERVRGAEASEALPIVVLTGKGSESVAVEALKIGAQDYISKDLLRAETLKRSIDNAIAKVALHRRIERGNQELRLANAELEKIRDSLESQVQERTVELESARADAEEDNRMKDEFLAMLSHELRNPLAPIQHALEVLKRTPDPAVRERTVDVINRQFLHLKRIVDDLLDVSRLTRGNIELKIEHIDLAEVARSSVRSMVPKIGADEQHLTVSIPDVPIWVQGDATRLEQAFLNLIQNASKFTSRGGRIDVTLAEKDGLATFAVTDDGVGISADVMPRIFDLFAQGKPHLDRSGGGLGIGLTVVRNLVELHGGRVEAFSAGVGQGSRFTVQLATAPAISRRPQPAREHPRVDPLRILVVDDNADAAQYMAAMLALEGHEVRACHDGREALQMVEGFRPEAILLDIGLPVMDGYEVARQLRGRDPNRTFRLIAVTGYGQARDRDLAEAAGFDRHLTKPVDPEVLFAAIRRETGRRERTP